jgi:two-component system chemotaxis response regulator CheB
MNAPLLRTFLIDDSLVFRKIISDILWEVPGIEIAGQAPNGKIALLKLPAFKPDLVILDMEMPEMGGLEVLNAIKALGLPCGVIVLSGSSPHMGSATMKALDAGAFDFVAKPNGETIEETKSLLSQNLKEAVLAFQAWLKTRVTGATSFKKPDAVKPQKPPEGRSFSGQSRTAPADSPKIGVETTSRPPFTRADLFVIGISTGGPPALVNIFSRISKPLKAPVLIVQHIPPLFSEALAHSIREKSGLAVEEAKHGSHLESGHIYIAPGGSHLRLAQGSETGQFILQVSQDSPENNCRPSVDYLLRSVAKVFSGRTAFLIMTGMGTDGLAGAGMIRAAGGYILAQSEDSCTVFGMPKAVIEAGFADEVISLGDIPARIERITSTGISRIFPATVVPPSSSPPEEKK